VLTFTLREGLGSCAKGEITLKRHYRIGEFAKMASVTMRTLRFYEEVGLLSAGEYTESGYRLYRDEDLVTLEHILALKFLGLSLDEIRECLRRGPKHLAEALSQQRAMMQEKRSRLDEVIRAIADTEALLAAGTCDWESVAKVISAIRMEKENDWVKKYFTDEQLQTMNDLATAAYSDEAKATLANRGGEWTEADQEKATADWTRVASEARRLAAEGADPGGPDGQAVAKLKNDLLSGFTGGDPEVSAGLSQFWEGFHALPREQQPFDASPFDAGEEGTRFLEQACAIYQERAAS
jgi:DNA-binding transcriptional MerR regulator